MSVPSFSYINYNFLLDSINTRFTKRLRNRSQVPEREPREPGRPGRRHRGQVRLPQPVRLDVRDLAVPIKVVLLYRVIWPDEASRSRQGRRQRKSGRHGAGWEVRHDGRRGHDGTG